MVPPRLSRPPRLVVVCGQTASGKGGLARALARRLDGEIVAADSRKIYRGLDIGTAKPDAVARAELGYHLIDVAEPDEVFSAARYAALADRAIAAIAGRGRLPLVVGGTGLYLRALLYGLIDTPPADQELRRRLERQHRQRPGSLHAELRRVDPAAAARIAPGDALRLVRALEVHALTGRPLSAVQADHGFDRPRYPAYALAVAWPAEQLAERIAARVDRMLAAGWLDEVCALRRAGAGRVLRVVGYRQLAAHLDGACSLDQARRAIRRAHRRYARQQRKWFRADPAVRWLDAPVDAEVLAERLRRWLVGQAAETQL